MAAAQRARPRGLHVLCGKQVRALAARSSARPGDLVLDLGAGTGVITRELVRRGFRVWAVENDTALVARLRRSLAGEGSVRVVHADVLAMSLPREPFHVVANVPFHVTSALLRRLLREGRWMVRADLVVQWGAAIKHARTRGDGRWAVELGPRVAARGFHPPPPVDGAILTVRRKGRTPSRGGGRGS